jgi:hypothetical protein
MKTLSILLFTIVLSFQGFSQDNTDTIISNNSKNLKLKVLYFHITNRCNTCRGIEATVRKTINENFKTELDNGIIDLYIVNCELPENKTLAKKYDAYGATLALTKVENGSEIKINDITNFAFSKIHDEAVFISELKSQIQELLKP